MKKILLILLACVLVFSFAACTAGQTSDPGVDDQTPTPENPVIRLSTTTSVNDSGLLAYLQPSFEAATGYRLEISSAGTGAAIQAAKDGNADCLLVHSKSQEEAYIADGFGEVRVPFMYNFFVVIGPKDDAANVKEADTAADAFSAIADSGSTFISRGDASGTHTKELGLWVAAGQLESADATADGTLPVIDAPWYLSIGQGMGATLNMAQEKLAYTLSDKATFLANAANLADLDILLERADDMMNTYSMIAVTPERYDDTNYEGAQAFVTWMTSAEAKQLIADFGVAEYGQQLFFNLEDE
ncbi:MAG: solute-binding protein [Clostridia bacterium]|nr:solute-binding protein [Clostridia bacterium]